MASETERRVYVLPTELVARLCAFQQAEGIPSEVEAARRLLKIALDRRDTAATIMPRLLRAKAQHPKATLREIFAEVAADHPLLEYIEYGSDHVLFHLVDRTCGILYRNGQNSTWLKPNEAELAEIPV